MRTDEVRPGRERRVGEAADFALHAAHIGHKRAGRQVRRDVARKARDPVHRRSEHHKRGTGGRSPGRVGDRIAPWLAAQGAPRLGPARPDRDTPGEAALARSAGDGPAEQAWSEDDKIVQHDRWKRAAPVFVEPVAHLRRNALPFVRTAF